MNKKSRRVLSALVAINVATLGGTVQAVAEEQPPQEEIAPAPTSTPVTQAAPTPTAPEPTAPAPQPAEPAEAPAPPQASPAPGPVEEPKPVVQPITEPAPRENAVIADQEQVEPQKDTEPASAPGEKTQAPESGSKGLLAQDKPGRAQESPAKGGSSSSQNSGEGSGNAESAHPTTPDIPSKSDSPKGQDQPQDVAQNNHPENVDNTAKDQVDQPAPNTTPDAAPEPDIKAAPRALSMRTVPKPAGTTEEGSGEIQQGETGGGVQNRSAVYVDGAHYTNARDSYDGSSYENAYGSLQYALEHLQGATTIYLRGSFSLPDTTQTVTWDNQQYWAVITNGVTLYIDGETHIKCGTNKINGIRLRSGATLKGRGTLYMSDFYTALYCEEGSHIRDGHYEFSNNGDADQKVPVAGLVLSDDIKGSSRDKLTIVANDNCDTDFIKWHTEYEINSNSLNDPTNTNSFTKCTITVSSKMPAYVNTHSITLNDAFLTANGFGDPSQHGTGFYTCWLSMSNNSYLSLGNSIEASPKTALATQNYGFDISNSTIVINAGSKCGWSYGANRESKIRNSTIIFNNGGGVGFNVSTGTVVLDNSIIRSNRIYRYQDSTTGQVHAGAIFYAQHDESHNGNIIFTGNCRVEPLNPQDNSSNGKRVDNNFIVLGGSYNVKYLPDPDAGSRYNINDHTFNGTRPNNGPDNFSEKLSLFTLSDRRASDPVLHPLNIQGKAYGYDVKLASSDGQKHVWVPAAPVVFKLNADGADPVTGAAFADGSTVNKSAYAMRGYALRDAKSIADGSSTTLPMNPVASGYRFVGWFYKDNGVEKEFNEGTTVTSTPKSPLYVYAKWALVRAYGSTVHTDLLLNNDTESNSAVSVAKNSTHELAVRFSGSSVKDDISAIAKEHQNLSHRAIRLYSPSMVFDVTLDLPDAMSLPYGLDASLIRLGSQDFKVTDAKQSGNHLTMRVQLRRPADIKTYADLEDAVMRALDEDGWLKLTIPGMRVKSNAPVASDLIVRALLNGSLTVDAEPENGGARRAYRFTWTGVQWPDGRDAVAGDDDGIRLTARVAEVEQPEAPEAPKVTEPKEPTPATPAPPAPHSEPKPQDSRQVAVATHSAVLRVAPQDVPEAPEATENPAVPVQAASAKHASSGVASVPQTGDDSAHGASLLAMIGSAFVALAAAIRRHGKKA